MNGTVVHVVVAGEVGGAERMLVDLAAGAETRRHVIALVTPSARLRALFEGAQASVHDRGPAREGPVDYLVRTFGSRDVAWLEGILREERAAFVHVHTFGSQVLGTRAARRVGLPVVRTEHSTRVYDDPSCWPFSRWSLARTTRSVCISEHVRQVAQRRAPWAADRMSIVPNGVDTERFAPPTASEREGPLRTLALGRLDRRKGIDIALHALARTNDVVLEIAGDGPERRALESLARDLRIEGRVRFSGFAEDVRPAVARADVLLSSARTEGLGVALLEGMAMERPAVALPVGGVPEIVREGLTGFVARGTDDVALAAALERARREPLEVTRRGRLARELVTSSYSLSAMRRGYEAVYASLESQRTPSQRLANT